MKCLWNEKGRFFFPQTAGPDARNAGDALQLPRHHHIGDRHRRAGALRRDALQDPRLRADVARAARRRVHQAAQGV